MNDDPKPSAVPVPAPAPAPETPRGTQRIMAAYASKGGETVHALSLSVPRQAYCGCEASPIGVPFEPDSAYACRRCLRALLKATTAAPALPLTAPRLLDGSNEDLAIARADAVEAAAELSAPAAPADAGPSDETDCDLDLDMLYRGALADLGPDAYHYKADVDAARDRIAARLREYREALGDLPCMFVWQGRREGKPRTPCDDTFEPIPEHAWCPNCRARARALSPSREGDGRKEG